MQPPAESPQPSEVGVAQSDPDLLPDLASATGLRQRAIMYVFRAVRAAYLRCKPIFLWGGNEFEFVRLVRALSQDYLLPAMDEKALDTFYASRLDPWGYTREELERLRFRSASAILAAATNGSRFARAIEIGCSEGTFTELLAPTCDSLLAVDISTVALERARSRRAWPASVKFAKLDLVSDALPGQFDLVVITDVLNDVRPMIRDRRKLRTVCGKLAKATREDGYILVGDYREDQVFETTVTGRWLGRHMLRSARWILPILAEQRGLSEIISGQTSSHMFAVLRKHDEKDSSDNTHPHRIGADVG